MQFSLEGTGGIQRVVPALAKELSDRGHEVSAVSFYGGISRASWKYRYVIEESSSRNWYHKIVKSIERIKVLLCALKESHPDVLIASSQGATIVSLLAVLLSRRSIPVVVYAHESLSAGAFSHRLLMRALYPQAHRIVCVSEGLRDEFRKLISIRREKIVTIYNAFISSESESACDVYPEHMPRPHLISASRLEDERGVLPLVKAFSRYAQCNSGTLILCGTGSQEHVLRNYVSAQALESRVVFLGFCAHAPACIARADCYVSCARREAFGMSLLEAIAAHVPVVTTDAAYGPREILGVENVTPDEYPVETRLGALFSEPEVASTDPALFAERFASGVHLVLTRKSSSATSDFDERIAAFALERQVSNWEELLTSSL